MSDQPTASNPAPAYRFRPAMEQLEMRAAPAAIAITDFYTVRSGRTLNQTRVGRFGNGLTGVLSNDSDSLNRPVSNRGMSAALISGPVDLSTGLPVTTPFTFNSNGGFTFRAPRNFSGPVRFTYQATTAGGLVSGTTSAFINVVGPVRRVAVGADAGAGPAVTVYDATTKTQVLSFFAFDPGFHGGVRVATGDFNADNTDDIVAAAGAGGGPHVKVFDGRTGGQIASFFAFDTAFTGGVEVSTGDLNGDDTDELVVSAGSGGFAHVKVFDGTKVSTAGFDSDPTAQLASFFAYDAGVTNGVRTAVGDIDGDGNNKLITAPAAGGTVVQTFDLSSGTPVVTKAFYAGDPADSRGLFVTAGDFNGDFIDDIAVGSGSGRPEARIYTRSAADPTAMQLDRTIAAASFADGFVADTFTTPFTTNPQPDYLVGTGAAPAAPRSSLVGTATSPKPGAQLGYTGGMRVGVDFANRDNFADLVIAQGPNGYSRFQILSGQDLTQLVDITQYAGFFGGITVAGHN